MYASPMNPLLSTLHSDARSERLQTAKYPRKIGGEKLEMMRARQLPASSLDALNVALEIWDECGSTTVSMTVRQPHCASRSPTTRTTFSLLGRLCFKTHDLTDADYFSLTLRDEATNSDIVSRSYSSAGPIGTGTQGVTWSQFGNWFSSGWVVEQIDLVALGAVRHNFTLTLLASDYPYGGRARYEAAQNPTGPL